jgi:HlyD family secretion protein
MKKRIVPILLIVAAVVGFLLWRNGVFAAKANGHLTVSGNLEMTEVDLSFKVAGKLTELNIREGSYVKKGDVIARLDPSTVVQQKARDQALLDQAQNQYTQTGTQVEYQRAAIDSDLALRRAELQQAEARLAELLAGSRKQEIESSQAALAEARVQLDWARSEWERAQRLYKNEDISTAQYDQARSKFNAAGQQVRQAEQRLALIQEGPRQEEISMARAQVDRAKAAVKLSEASRIDLKRREQELGARKAEIDRAKAQVGITQTQLEDMVLVAPVDGVVLVKSAELGEVLAAGSTVVTIADIDHPWMRGYINEQDLGKVKIGGEARVITDSYPGKAYNGRISYVASEAEFTPKQIQTREERVKLVYRIKIEVANPQRELKNNMPADAEIVLQ